MSNNKSFILYLSSSYYGIQKTPFNLRKTAIKPRKKLIPFLSERPWKGPAAPKKISKNRHTTFQENYKSSSYRFPWSFDARRAHFNAKGWIIRDMERYTERKVSEFLNIFLTYLMCFYTSIGKWCLKIHSFVFSRV